MGAAMARSSHLTGTIQNVLDGKINIFALSLASNLDAIGKSTDGSMSPTRTAVLRNVLIQRVR
jgi:acylphosphatase